MGLTINQMDDYSLISIFNLFNVREKIAIERVCKRWQQIVTDLLDKQKGLKLAKIPNWMKCNDCSHSTNGGDVCDYINYPNDSHKVKKILIVLFRKCPNIRCLELKWSGFEFEEAVKLFSWLLWLCPNLECLRIYVSENKTAHGFGKAIELMGPKMIHLAAYQSSNWVINSTDINALISKMPNLQQLVLVGFHIATSSSFELGSHLRALVTDCLSESNIDSIVRCKRIENLQMFGALDQLGFQKICHEMPQLKYFTVRLKDSVQDFSSLSEVKDLQHFGLSNINYYELKDISSRKMVFSKKNQVFSDLTKTSDAFVSGLSMNKFALSNLRSFSLYGITIDRSMLSTFSEQLPNIENLKLNKCCFRCICSKKEQNCDACQQQCSLLLSKWPKLREITFDHPENQILIRSLPHFHGLRAITINHIRLHPNNRFYLDNYNTWIHCYDIFKSCYLLAKQTKDQIKVDLNIHLDNIIRLDVKSPKNLSLSFNYFSNTIF